MYGGDMQGNLWKFDLSDRDPANWRVALDGAPLFTAVRENRAQPITGGIEVTAGPGGGVSVFFGTGQYFAADDNNVSSSSPVQTMYGIWDDLKTAVSGRSALIAQSIGSTSDGTVRTVSRNAVNYV
ncbi:PilC/PilY family type IV pilus protein, partial [Xanthomonas citri pv. citri]